jgi:hypothetical protein
MTPDAFRALALALPEASEGQHNGHADFRVGGRIFASLGMPDAEFGMVKLQRVEQEVVVANVPEVYSPAPGSWGLKGSTRVYLPLAQNEQIAGALSLAWRHLAPKRLVEEHDRSLSS